MQLDNHLNSFFPNLELKSPLFYNHPIGIRFELGGCLEDIQATINRSSVLFESLNDKEDDIFAVFFFDFSEEKSLVEGKTSINLTLKNFFSKSNKEFTLSEKIIPFRYRDEDGDENVSTFQASINCVAETLFVNEFFEANAKQYYFQNQNFFVPDTFFINRSKNIIFHMYDDRGLDIVSKDENTLRPIYNRFKEWVLDFDSERIAKIFEE